MRRIAATVAAVVLSIGLTCAAAESASASVALKYDRFDLINDLGIQIYKYTSSIDRAIMCTRYQTGGEARVAAKTAALAKKLAKLKGKQGLFTAADYTFVGEQVSYIICDDYDPTLDFDY